MVAHDLAADRVMQAGRRVSLRRFVNGLLFLTVLASPFVLIEPSPYELLFVLLALAALAAGLQFDRLLLPLALLLLAWNMSGLLSLLPFLSDARAVTFIATSFYLAATAILFACIFSEETMQRLALLNNAYICAAVIATLIGSAAYFGMIPGAELFVPETHRVQSTFKDPNVFGPFLILPILFLFGTILQRGVSMRHLVLISILIAGLFLSFSRGAWAHFALSFALMLALTSLTTSDARFRTRIAGFALLAAFGIMMLLIALLSVDAIRGMFTERAVLLQHYDVGQWGRFGRQAEGLLELLDRPMGFGPLQFSERFGLDPHNVYLNAFASYGWIGGFAYLALVLSTLVVGLRAIFIPTGWQPYLIPIYATFVGVCAQGVVIDTDHWRHYYLLMGLIWGLAVATKHVQRRAMSLPAFAAEPPQLAGPQRPMPAGRLADRVHFRL